MKVTVVFRSCGPLSTDDWVAEFGMVGDDKSCLPVPAEGELVARYRTTDPAEKPKTFIVFRRHFAYSPEGIRIDLYLELLDEPLDSASTPQGKVIPFPDRQG